MLASEAEGRAFESRRVRHLLFIGQIDQRLTISITKVSNKIQKSYVQKRAEEKIGL